MGGGQFLASQDAAALRRWPEVASDGACKAQALASPDICVLLPGGERTLRITEEELAGADPVLRPTCVWSAADGLWRVAGTPSAGPPPQDALGMWRQAGLEGVCGSLCMCMYHADSCIVMSPQLWLRRQCSLVPIPLPCSWLADSSIRQLQGSFSGHRDRQVAGIIQKKLSHDGPETLQRLFRRSQLARRPCWPWNAALAALQLEGKRKAVGARAVAWLLGHGTSCHAFFRSSYP